MMQYEGASSIYSNVLEGFNYAFTAFFNIELVFKLMVHGFLFFKNSWNRFDFVVVILCDFVVILNIFSYIGVIDTHSMSTLPIILRLFRIFRIFRIISTFGKLRALIDTLVYMIKNGMKVKEVQVEMSEREFGTSYLNAWKSIEYMLNVVISIIFVQAFRKNKKKGE